MYLNEQSYLSKQMEEDVHSLIPSFDKNYKNIQLNGELINNNDKNDFFKKEYLQGSYVLNLLLNDYNSSPPPVNLDKLLSEPTLDGIVQQLPFHTLQLPGQSPSKTTINNNQVKLRASDFLY